MDIEERKTMKTRTSRILVRFVLALAALCLGIGLASAQTPMGGKTAQTVPYRSPQTTMKMRSTTNAQRRAAAARNAKRKVAAGQKNQVIQKTQNGVTK